jgi:hypothetical protein
MTLPPFEYVPEENSKQTPTVWRNAHCVQAADCNPKNGSLLAVFGTFLGYGGIADRQKG